MKTFSCLALLLLAFPTCPQAGSNSRVTIGIGDYSLDDAYIGFYGPCRLDLEPLEVSSEGWPEPNSGTSVCWWPNQLEGNILPIYWFGVYAYAPGTLPFGDFFPGDPAGVYGPAGDCFGDFDPFTDYGTFGLGGAEGTNPCQGTTSVGEDEEYVEDPHGISWGRIKAIYR